MDETYIKMCKEAKEIQESYNHSTVETHIIKNIFVDSRGNFVWYIETFGEHGELLKFDQFWLPRQEDLQEIIESMPKIGLRGPWLLTRSFLRFVENLIPKKLIKYDLNVCWLCFVMETCYNKRWNGETWEEI